LEGDEVVGQSHSQPIVEELVTYPPSVALYQAQEQASDEHSYTQDNFDVAKVVHASSQDYLRT